MEERKVIYTAIFGGYERLIEPAYKPSGFDFVCFTDKAISSKHWEVRVVEPIHEDSVRSARKYKILPHRYLGSYDISVWVDGNLLVRGDLNELVAEYLKEVPMAVFDHKDALHNDKKKSPNNLGSVKEQLEHLLAMDKRGRTKDNPETMEAQYARYAKEGFPDDGGLLLSMVLARRHNNENVREGMELWWDEVQRGSNRDQLSFNYVAWKVGIPFVYIHENVRDNKYVLHNPHAK